MILLEGPVSTSRFDDKFSLDNTFKVINTEHTLQSITCMGMRVWFHIKFVVYQTNTGISSPGTVIVQHANPSIPTGKLATVAHSH